MPIQQTWTGNIQPLLNEMQKLEAANAKLRQGQQQHSRESKQFHNQLIKHTEDQVAAVKHMVTGTVFGLLSVEKAVEGVKDSYSEWRSEIKELAAKSRETNTELVKMIALSGQAANAGFVAERLKNIPGVTKRQATEAYGGVHAGAPAETNVGKLLSLTTEAAQVAKVGAGIDLAQFGELVGTTSTLVPGWNAKDTSDLALTIKQRLGRYESGFESRRQFPAIRELVTSGLFGSTEQALGVLTTAAENNPTMASQLRTVVETDYEKPRGEARRTAEGKAKAALVGKTPVEKGQILREHPEYAEALGVKGFSEALTSSKATEATRAFENVRGARERLEEELGRSAEGRERQVAQEEAVIGERGGRPRAAVGKQYDRAYEALESALKERNGSFFDDFLTRRAVSIGRTVSPLEQMITGEDDAISWSNILKTGSGRASEIFLEGENKIAGYKKYDPANGQRVSYDEETLKKILGELEKGNRQREHEHNERRGERRTGAQVNTINES